MIADVRSKCFLICSAGPRGLCGDQRIFDEWTKVPQVFRNPGGSLRYKKREQAVCHADEFTVTGY